MALPRSHCWYSLPVFPATMAHCKAALHAPVGFPVVSAEESKFVFGVPTSALPPAAHVFSGPEFCQPSRSSSWGRVVSLVAHDALATKPRAGVCGNGEAAIKAESVRAVIILLEAREFETACRDTQCVIVAVVSARDGNDEVSTCGKGGSPAGESNIVEIEYVVSGSAGDGD